MLSFSVRALLFGVAAWEMMGVAADGVEPESVGLSVGPGEAFREGEEEEPEIPFPLESGTVMFVLTIMVAFSVIFENGKEHLLESTNHDMLPVLNSLFGELTLLGFIGLLLFLADKLNAVGEFSEHIFGEEGYIGEMCEAVHMALFMVMLLFLGTVILLVHFSQRNTRIWRDFEDDILDQDRLRSDYQRIKSDRSGAQAYLEPMIFRKVSYAAIRNRFLQQSKLPHVFDFSGYLTPLLGHVLAEVVEVPVGTWIGLEIFMLSGWAVSLVVSHTVLGGIAVVLGYALPYAMHVVHMKMRHIKLDCAMSSDLANLIGEDARPSAAAQEGTSLLQGGTSNILEHFVPTNIRTGITKKGHHHRRFWKGEQLGKEAPDFIVTVVRYILLLNSIYVAVFLLVLLPGMLQEVANGAISATFLAVVLVVAAIPPVVVVQLAPHAIKDFVMVAHIESMKNNRVVEAGIRRLRTRNAFLCLKVVYMMLNGIKKGSGNQATVRVNPRKHMTTTQLQKARTVWKQIFDVFDEDKSKNLTPLEISRMLTIMGGDLPQSDIARVIAALDSSHDGNVDFEEFFEYAIQISFENAQSGEEIASGIFDLVDKGNSTLLATEEDEDENDEEDDEENQDEIDLAELCKALEAMKQDLSPDDVYNVIKDIDEDGNGRLNKEEFHELLIRLGVV